MSERELREAQVELFSGSRAPVHLLLRIQGMEYDPSAWGGDGHCLETQNGPGVATPGPWILRFSCSKEYSK